MLPAGVVGVGRHAWKPVSHLVQIVPVFLEEFVTGSRGDESGIVDFVRPLERKPERLLGSKRNRQIDSHHRLDDRVFESFSIGPFDV